MKLTIEFSTSIPIPCPDGKESCLVYHTEPKIVSKEIDEYEVNRYLAQYGHITIVAIEK